MHRAEAMYRALRTTRHITIPRTASDTKLRILETMPPDIARRIIESIPSTAQIRYQFQIRPLDLTFFIDELPITLARFSWSRESERMLYLVPSHRVPPPQSRSKIV